MASYDLSKFTKPAIRTAEHPIDAATGLFTGHGQAEITGDDFATDTPLLVDRIVFCEDTLITEAADPGNHTSLLAALDMRYWLRGMENREQNWMPLMSYDTRGRSLTNPWPWPFNANGAAIPQIHQRSMRWYLPRTGTGAPLSIPPRGTVYTRWSNPVKASAGAFAAGTIHVALHGTGAQSNRPVRFYTQAITLASAGGGAAGPTARSPSGAAALNDYEEEVNIWCVVVSVDTARYAVNDTRLFRHLRLNIEIEPQVHMFTSEQDPAPLVAWGSDQAPDSECVVFEPQFPILIENKNAINFGFRNGNNVNGTQIITSLVGREM